MSDQTRHNIFTHQPNIMEHDPVSLAIWTGAEQMFPLHFLTFTLSYSFGAIIASASKRKYTTIQLRFI